MEKEELVNVVKKPRAKKVTVEKVTVEKVEPAKARKGRFEKGSEAARAYMKMLREKKKPKDKKDEPKII